MYKWIELRRAAISLLFPNRCPFCDRIIGMWDYWCDSCYDKLQMVDERLTPPEGIDEMLSCCYYNGRARSAVLRMKNGYYIYAIETFAVMMTELAGGIMNSVDLVTAVPTSWQRYGELGYSQSEKIARLISARSRKRYKRVLVVSADKIEQKRLKKSERFENANRSYKIRDDKYIIGKNILLVDDVSTTGATLSAIALQLKAAGANKVYGLTFAKTREKTDT